MVSGVGTAQAQMDAARAGKRVLRGSGRSETNAEVIARLKDQFEDEKAAKFSDVTESVATGASLDDIDSRTGVQARRKMYTKYGEVSVANPQDVAAKKSHKVKKLVMEQAQTEEAKRQKAEKIAKTEKFEKMTKFGGDKDGIAKIGKGAEGMRISAENKGVASGHAQEMFDSPEVQRQRELAGMGASDSGGGGGQVIGSVTLGLTPEAERLLSSNQGLVIALTASV